MITKVSVVTVLTRDQDAAYRFFTEILGFRKQTDLLVDGKRSLSVVPATGEGPEFTLFDPRTWMPPEPAADMLGLIGRMPGLVLATDDCRKTVADMKAKDVKILLEPTDYPYGVEAVFADPDGNAYVLLELR